jgi:histidine triad (HIT) family protein
MSCIFCEIARKNIKAEIIFENEKIISFLDINPVNFGHTLVIPKKHFADFISIEDEYLLELNRGIKIAAKAVTMALKAEGYNIFSNNGLAAGQSVFHFHAHIVPRFSSDHIKFKPELKIYSENEMKIYAEKIKNELIL